MPTYIFNDNVLTDVTYLSGWLNKITVTENGIYIYISTRGGDSKLYFSPFGSDHMTELTHESGKILDYFADGDKIYMSAMRGLDGGEFYMLDPASGTELRLTDFNTALKGRVPISPDPKLRLCQFRRHHHTGLGHEARRF